jgi:TolB-like protein
MRLGFFSAFAISMLTGIPVLAGLPITLMNGQSPATAPAASTNVLLVPFRAVGPAGDRDWISQAVDEDLSHDLSRNTAIHLIRPSTTQPLSPADALAAARSAGADQLIDGSYQLAGDQLRITGEVVNVNDGKPIAQIKATGTERELFNMEDALATQLWHTLPRPDQASATASDYDIQVTPVPNEVSAAYAAPSEPTQQTTNIAQPTYDVPSYPFAGVYPYGYGDYGYPFGFGYPIFIYGGYGFHYHHYGSDYHNAIGRGNLAGPALPPIAPAHFGGRGIAGPHTQNFGGIAGGMRR